MDPEKVTPFQTPRKGKAKPDDGEFFRFSWKVAEAIYETDFTKVQHRLVMYVIRKTWGWNKKTFIFTLASAAREMGIDKAHLSRAYHALIRADVLKTDRGEVGFNKYREQWNIDHLQTAVNQETERRKRTVADAATDENRCGPGNAPLRTRQRSVADAAISTPSNPAPTDGLGDPYRQLIDKEIDNSSSMRETSKFAAHLATLMTVANYPFDAATDTTMLAKFEGMYPGIDLLQEINSWSVYKLGKPIAKKDNPRGQLNTWMRKASEPPKYGPPRKAASDAAKAELDAWFKGG